MHSLMRDEPTIDSLWFGSIIARPHPRRRCEHFVVLTHHSRTLYLSLSHSHSVSLSLSLPFSPPPPPLSLFPLCRCCFPLVALRAADYISQEREVAWVPGEVILSSYLRRIMLSDRHTDRQTDTQTDRQTHRQTDTQPHTQTQRHREGERQAKESRWAEQPPGATLTLAAALVSHHRCARAARALVTPGDALCVGNENQPTRLHPEQTFQ